MLSIPSKQWRIKQQCEQDCTTVCIAPVQQFSCHTLKLQMLQLKRIGLPLAFEFCLACRCSMLGRIELWGMGSDAAVAASVIVPRSLAKDQSDSLFEDNQFWHAAITSGALLI